MPIMPRFQITEAHYRAASDVPMQIANDPTASNADRLKVAQILQGLMKIVWEDELYMADLAELAPQAKEKVIYIRYDPDFYGNNAHEIERKKREEEARQEAEERRAAGLPVEEEPPAPNPSEPTSSEIPPTSRKSPVMYIPAPQPPDEFFEQPIPIDFSKRPWWQDEYDFERQERERWYREHEAKKKPPP